MLESVEVAGEVSVAFEIEEVALYQQKFKSVVA
jgi:hypothetical protein